MKRTPATLVIASLFVAALSLPALAQDNPEPTTISVIEREDISGEVYLEGAALEQVDDDEYFFSDGTGTIKLDFDSSSAELPVPLYELIGVKGTVASDEIDATEWALLPIMTPAVIVPEEDVIRAFQGWIVAYGSQEPAATE